MAKIIVRPARSGDAADIYEMNLALGYEYDLEKTRQNLEWLLAHPFNTVLVAEINGQPAGYIQLIEYQCTCYDRLLEIPTLAVKDLFQRSGVGHALLCAAEAVAKEQGAAGIRLESGFDRTGAHRFYEKNGYVHRKDHKNYIKIFN